MSKKTKARVLVAGAGPVGLLTALQLERNGVRTQIVDESWREGQRSQATALHPTSQKLLDEMGFVDRLHGHRINQLALYRGHNLAESVDLSSPLLVVSQTRLESALAGQLEEEFKRPVDWNHRVHRLEQGPDAVEVSIDRLGRESTGYAASGIESAIEKTLDREFEAVIGADGHNSVVRRAIGAEWTEVAPAETYAIFEMTASGEPDSILRIAFLGSKANVLWPLTDGRWRWAFEIDPVKKPDVRQKPRLSFEIDEHVLEVGKERLTELVKQRAPWFEGWYDDLVWSATIRFERRMAEPFGSGRVWLAGDAAHVTTPIGIQSMNRGLREASELGWRVPRLLNKKRADLLEKYNEEQSEVWRILHGLERKLVASDIAPPWLTEHKDRLRGCLPATGFALDRLLERLGMTAKP